MPFYQLSKYVSSTDRPVTAIEPTARVSTELPTELPSDITGFTTPHKHITIPQTPQGPKDEFTFESPVHSLLEPYEQLRTQWSPYEQQMASAAPLSIIIAYEGTFSEKALTLGFAWARRYHAQVRVVHVSEKENEKKEIEMLESVQRILENQKSDSYFKAYPPKVVMKKSEQISEGLVLMAHEHRASLIVLATHGRNEHGDKLRHGSVAEEVLKKAPCPVLIGHSDFRDFHPKVILAPIDFSPFSYRAIAHGIILSRDFQSHLYLFHTSEDLNHRKEERNKLEGLMTRMHWQNVEHELVIESGDLVTAMVDFCVANDVGLITIGTHRVDYDQHTYANSLTSELIQRAPCPVFVVHPEI